MQVELCIILLRDTSLRCYTRRTRYSTEPFDFQPMTTRVELFGKALVTLPLLPENSRMNIENRLGSFKINIT